MEQKFIIPHDHAINKDDRRKANGHGSVIVWFTGLPSSGKSTLAGEVQKKLMEEGVKTYILDGDNIRMGLCKGLGFSEEDRAENIRRIGEVSKLFVDAGVVTLSAFVSPYRKDRDMVRELVEEGEFIEVFVHCPVEECEKRDVKGLYKKARAGEIKGFTGIDDPYEEPVKPEMVIETHKETLEESAGKVYDFLKNKI
ncbi:MAG: adenylyl-sulfate kinase [Candidatus Mycalebacterium zealandia]|nr:MAG: adenylyl-sulfate kinase [Candidatus Mycalebacterium zealandia]